MEIVIFYLVLRQKKNLRNSVPGDKGIEGALLSQN
jgi:hypothetical protein